MIRRLLLIAALGLSAITGCSPTEEAEQPSPNGDAAQDANTNATAALPSPHATSPPTVAPPTPSEIPAPPTPIATPSPSAEYRTVQVRDRQTGEMVTKTIRVTPATPYDPEADGAVAPDLVLPLPGDVNDVIVGGNGRYLLLLMKRLQKVAVVDLRQGSVKYVSVDGGLISIAGGATRFVVVDQKNSTLTRWNYENLEAFEAREPFGPSNVSWLGAEMGLGSEGPLLLYGKKHDRYAALHLIDLNTLQDVTAKMPWRADRKAEGVLHDQDDWNVRASIDGQSFLFASRSLSVVSARVLAGGVELKIDPDFTGSSTTREKAFAYDHSYRLDLPDVTGGGTTLTDAAPALPPHYWTSFTRRSQSTHETTSVDFHMRGESTPIASLKLYAIRPSAGAVPIPPDHKRIFFSAVEKALVWLPRGTKQVAIKRFDMDAVLRQTARDFLTITSLPPSEFIVGRKYAYQIQAISSSGAVSYQLESGPPGMTVSATGLVEWTPAADAGEKQAVIVTVSDAQGGKKFHNIEMKRGLPPLTEVTVNGSSAPIDPLTPRVAIRLAGPLHRMALGGAGRYLVGSYESGREVVVVDLVERRFAKIIPFEDEVASLAAGATRFVIASKKGTISRWNFSRFQKEQAVAFAEPIVELAMGSASEGPLAASVGNYGATRGKAVLFDLSTLKLAPTQPTTDGESKYFLGCLAASANGRLFVSWEHDFSSADNWQRLLLRGDRAWFNDEERKGGVPLPAADGSNVFTIHSRNGSSNVTNIIDWKARTRLTVPAATGPYTLSWNIASDPRSDPFADSVALEVQDDATPQFAVPGVIPPSPPKSMSELYRDRFAVYRMFYDPIADAVVSLSPNADTVFLSRFVPDEVLGTVTGDYLYIASSPPTELRPLTSFTYQVEVKSRRGGVQFELVQGPTGAKISPSGKLTWNAPASEEELPIQFEVNVSDASGRKTHQRFEIAVLKSAPLYVPPASRPSLSPTPPVAATGNADVKSPASAEVVPEAADRRRIQEIALPGPLSKACVGGGGRYLAGFIKTLRQLVIIDVKERKIVKMTSLDDDDVKIAAGATKLVVALAQKNLLCRYDLATGESELTTPFEQYVKSMAMGCLSEGPLLVCGVKTQANSGHAHLLDVKTLKPTSVNIDQNANTLTDRIAAGPDGRRFLFGNRTCEVRGDRLAVIDVNGIMDGVFSADGNTIFLADEMTAFAEKWAWTSPSKERPFILMPATTGPLYLRLKLNGREPPTQIGVHVLGDSSPIIQLDTLPFPSTYYYDNRRYASIAEEFFFVPEGDACITLADGGSRVIVRRFNLNDELAATDLDYLFVASSPPQTAAVGKKLEYQLDVRSKRGGVKYRLDSNPSGMTVSPTGLITWTPAAGTPAESVVVMNVSDGSGRETFHSFRLMIDAGKTTVPRPAPPTPSAVTSATPKPAAMPKPSATAVAATKATAAVRTWTSNDGQYTIEAAYVEVTDGTITLRRADGTTIGVALDKLSEMDQSYIRQLTKPPK